MAERVTVAKPKALEPRADGKVGADVRHQPEGERERETLRKGPNKGEPEPEWLPCVVPPVDVSAVCQKAKSGTSARARYERTRMRAPFLAFLKKSGHRDPGGRPHGERVFRFKKDLETGKPRRSRAMSPSKTWSHVRYNDQAIQAAMSHGNNHAPFSMPPPSQAVTTRLVLKLT